MANIAGNFLDAMGIVTDSALQKYKYDMTIKATVLKTNVEDKATKYSCKYEGTTFTATGTAGEYEVDDIVYVVVPQSNWDMEKYIVFKVEKDLGESLDPFKNFLNVNNGHADKYFPERVQFVANYYQHNPGEGSAYNYPGVDENNNPKEMEYKLFDLSVQDEPFTRMGITIQFSTNHIVDWNCCEGNYGLYIKIYQQGMEDEEATIYSLDTSDMLGNVYTAEGWYEYKKVFDISGLKIDENTCIKFILMEDGNFNGYDENMNLHHKLHTYIVNDEIVVDEPPYEHTDDIIVAKNLNVYFGYAASDFSEGQIQLLCNSDMRYDPSWAKSDSMKKELKKKLKWYIYEKEKGYLVRKKIPVAGDRDNYVKVYYSKGDSMDFKQVAKVRVPNTSCTITITDTAEEKLVYMIKYWQKNLTFEDSNSPYLSKDSNMITFYRISAPEGEDIDLSTKMDKKDGTGSGSFSINRAVGSGIGINSVSMGTNNIASGNNSIAFGLETNAEGDSSFAEGYLTYAKGDYGSHAEGINTVAGGLASHTEGNGTQTGIQRSGEYWGGACAHAEGYATQASGQASHAEGGRTTLNISYTEGTYAYGDSSHAEGINTKTYGFASHAEGFNTIAGDENAEGDATYLNNGQHAEGKGTQAISPYSHAEGLNTIARSGYANHAEGWGTEADGDNGAHAEGQGTKASGIASHAEGTQCKALGDHCHAEGYYTNATAMGNDPDTGTTVGGASHSEGFRTTASGSQSHAEGFHTTAQGTSQHVFGQYNIPQNSYAGDNIFSYNSNGPIGYVEIVGGGYYRQNQEETYVELIPKNIRTLTWQGNEYLAGDLFLKGNSYRSVTDELNSKIDVSLAMYKNDPIGTGKLRMNQANSQLSQGNYCTVLGYNNFAYGHYSQIEGYNNIAYGDYIHVSGQYNKSDYQADTYATNVAYHLNDVVWYGDRFYYCLIEMTEADGDWDSDHWSEYRPGKTYLEIVGNGTSDGARSNARILDQSGNETLAGDLTSQNLNCRNNLTLGTAAYGGGNIILHYKDSNNTVHHIDVGATLVNLGYIQYTPPQP